MAEYKKPTDQVHVITLPSEITHALWRRESASVDEKVNLEVCTHFVGNGSEILITIKDKTGNTIEEIDGLVNDDYFSSSIVVPGNAEDELVFTADLPKHNLSMDSDTLRLIPPRIITNARWGQEAARRGDIVKLMADTEGISDETEVMVSIYEHDQDGEHDFITKFPIMVKQNKIEAEWEYEYHEDTDEISTQEELDEYGGKYNPPEYFFVINVDGQVFFEKQESGLLRFNDRIEIELLDDSGSPVASAKYVIILADGSEIEGQLDGDGRAVIEDVPPGWYWIWFPDFEDESY
jgi:hypothetical protein